MKFTHRLRHSPHERAGFKRAARSGRIFHHIVSSVLSGEVPGTIGGAFASEVEGRSNLQTVAYMRDEIATLLLFDCVAPLAPLRSERWRAYA